MHFFTRLTISMSWNLTISMSWLTISMTWKGSITDRPLGPGPRIPSQCTTPTHTDLPSSGATTVYTTGLVYRATWDLGTAWVFERSSASCDEAGEGGWSGERGVSVRDTACWVNRHIKKNQQNQQLNMSSRISNWICCNTTRHWLCA